MGHCSVSLGEMERCDSMLFSLISVLSLGCCLGLVSDREATSLPSVLTLKLFLIDLASFIAGSSLRAIFLNYLGHFIALTSCDMPLLCHYLSSRS